MPSGQYRKQNNYNGHLIIDHTHASRIVKDASDMDFANLSPFSCDIHTFFGEKILKLLKNSYKYQEIYAFETYLKHLNCMHAHLKSSPWYSKKHFLITNLFCLAHTTAHVSQTTKYRLKNASSSKIFNLWFNVQRSRCQLFLSRIT